jgi:hypothetical protein
MAMELKALFEQVESVQFSIQVDIASGFRVFQRALEESDIAQSLVRHLQKHPEDRRKTFERLITLLDANDQPEYAHPYDAALAGYLHALNKTDPILAVLASQFVLKTPTLWWAKKLAGQILEGVDGLKMSFSPRDAVTHRIIELTNLPVLASYLSVETTTDSFSRFLSRTPKAPIEYSASESTTSHMKKVAV